MMMYATGTRTEAMVERRVGERFGQRVRFLDALAKLAVDWQVDYVI